MPCASFLPRPIPSSSLLASSGLYCVYFFAHSSPGKYGCHGAGTP